MRDWEKAHTLGKRTFYERYTDTLRLCPENYCLAFGGPGKWRAYRDEGATKEMHDKIQETIDIFQSGSTSEGMAFELGKLFPTDYFDKLWKERGIQNA